MNHSKGVRGGPILERRYDVKISGAEQLASSALVDTFATEAHLRPMSERIVIDPAVCGGRPIVAGTRMRVSDVLDALASGATIETLLADFPYLSQADVLACLSYGARAVDHKVVQAAA